ncbi:MAG: GEVED domain-containing protein, partial [Planctomycetaceae bacterium]|nr:GEVED domain-containing protein [Planctomycetaceae bacterium]
MSIWDSIRRLTGSACRTQNTSISGNGKKKAQKRQLQIEQFEDRILLSINSPELNAIFVNQDETQYFDPASTNEIYHIAPESFLLRFNEGQSLNPATLGAGIQVVRAGTDGQFGTADDVNVEIGWIGLNGSRGDGKDVVGAGTNLSLAEGIVGNEVIIRFAEALPDDLYQIRLVGSALKNLQGDNFHSGQNQAASFELNLGAHIIATVPQPTYRNQDGSIGQYRDQIVLYFNANDPLYFPGFNASSASAFNQTYATTDANYRNLFQLIATKNTADSSDDIVHTPTRIEYEPSTGKMTLTFANDLDKLPGFGTTDNAARLRVGNLYEETATSTLDLNLTDPGDAFHTSFNLAGQLDTTATAPQSLIIHGQIDPKYDPIEYPGARDEPGHSDLPINYGFDNENDENGKNGNTHVDGDTIGADKDSTDGPTIQYYNFKAVIGYDNNGSPITNEITEAQKNLARQIFQLYSRYLGIEFIEDTDTANPRGTIIATGNLQAIPQWYDAETSHYISRYTSVEGGDAGLYGKAFSLINISDLTQSNEGELLLYRQSLDGESIRLTSTQNVYPLVIMDKAEKWTDIYGGDWFVTAMKNIGYSIGLSGASDLVDGAIMGTSGTDADQLYPDDYDIIHGQYEYRPDSIDVDLYQFTVEKRGMFSAEIYAERQNAASLLDATITLYKQIKTDDGKITYETIARNDNYFGKDSFLELYLAEGTYFIGVSASGNDRYNPEIENSGEGGTTSGNYELRLNFTPNGVNPNDSTTYEDKKDIKTNLADSTNVIFDGDHDGTPGGVYDFWFNVQTQDKTIYVDKVASAGGNGSLTRPYNTIQAALNVAKEGDIIRIVGNNFEDDATNLTNNVAYEIGRRTKDNTNTILSDGATFDIPRGVTVVIDEGVVLKFAGVNINVGSFTYNDDRSGGSIQVLGTPAHSVYFTSFYDKTLGTSSSNLNTAVDVGDWGGISIRNDLDYEFINTYDPASGKTQREVLEEQGIFLNYINHAEFTYGGGTAVGTPANSIYSPINLTSARPTVTYNKITKSKEAAISADITSFEETRFESWDHNVAYTLDYDRVGPAIYGNTITGNSENGMYVRAKTTTDSTGVSVKATGYVRFDDTDIVHILQENLIVQGAYTEYYVSNAQLPNGTVKVMAPSLSVVDQQYPFSQLTSQVNADNDGIFDNSLLLNSVPADGEYFTLSDGTTSLTFEFNHVDKSNHDGVQQGHVQVDINSTDTLAEVQQKLVIVIKALSDPANYKKYIPSSVIQDTKFLQKYKTDEYNNPQYFANLTLNSQYNTLINGVSQLVKPFKIDAEVSDTIYSVNFDLAGTQIGNFVLKNLPADGEIFTLYGQEFEFNDLAAGGTVRAGRIAVKFDSRTDTVQSVIAEIQTVVRYFAVVLKFDNSPFNTSWHSASFNSLTLKDMPQDGEMFELIYNEVWNNIAVRMRYEIEFNVLDQPNSGAGVDPGQHHTYNYVNNSIENYSLGSIRVDILSTDSIADVVAKLKDTLYFYRYGNWGPTDESWILTTTVETKTIQLSSTGTKLEIIGTGLVKGNSAGRLMIDPGIIIKSYGSRIEAEMGAQILAEGTAAHPIIMTSLHDVRYGAGGTYTTFSANIQNPNAQPYLPQTGNWAGIYFGPNSSGSLDHIVLAFAGGNSEVGGSTVAFNPIEIQQADVRIADSRFEYNTGTIRSTVAGTSGNTGYRSATPSVIFVRGSQPVIVNNEFFNNSNGITNAANAMAVISINANSLSDESVIDWGRSTGLISNYSEYNDNYGALVRNNRFTGNSVNGMVIRGETLTVAGIWDDADIAHVLYNEIRVPDFHTKGGLLLMSAPANSLVIKLLGNNAGFTTYGTPSENENRIGGAIQIIGVPKYPVVLTSLKDDTIGAGFDLKKQVMFDVNNNKKTSPNETGQAGDWRSIKFDSYSNDRNILVISEQEGNAKVKDNEQNGTPENSQFLGYLATEDKNGDDTYHLGYEIYGSIQSDRAYEADVYQFYATPGTEIWVDIDSTMRELDLIIEIIDKNGVVLARSDNAYMEEYGYGSVEAYENVQAFTLNKDRWNRLDHYTINQRDPGLRFIVPGPGNEYYVRVRSALGISGLENLSASQSDDQTFAIEYPNPDKTDMDHSRLSVSFIFDYERAPSEGTTRQDLYGNYIIPMYGVENTEAAKQQAVIDAINNAGLSFVTARIAYTVDGNNDILSYIVLDGVELTFNPKNTGLVNLPNTSGSYTLQVRLQELDEVPGVTVTYADIRYATNGIEAIGFPQHSPIQGEYTNVAGSSFASAADVGNLLEADKGTISVSGYMTTLNQVDWYKFDLNYRGLQMIAGSNNPGNIWSAVFDIDYAGDSLARPDLTLWVFDSAGRLIYIGTDSNVADDQYDPTLASSIEKLSAGSVGPYDPFIGSAGLVAGIEGNGGNSAAYYVAVTNATTFANVLKEAQTRIEPVDSVQRIVEERVDQGQDMDGSWGDSTNEIEVAQRLTLTPDEYMLSDVVTYVGTSSGIYMIDPFTGQATLYRTYNSNAFSNNEIELRDNGKLYAIAGTGNVKNYIEINQAQVNTSVTSVSTQIQGKWYSIENNAVVWHDSAYTVQAMATSDYGYTAFGNGLATQGYSLSIGRVDGFYSSGALANEYMYPGYNTSITTNNFLFIHTATGVGATRVRTNNSSWTEASAGTNQAGASALLLTQFTEDNGLRSNSEIINAMTQGNDGRYYVVTDAGNVYWINSPTSQGWNFATIPQPVGGNITQVPAMRYNGGGPTLVYVGTCKDASGNTLNLTGIAAGPENVEGGTYADKLFITSTDNQLRAFVPGDVAGLITYSPVFVGGKESVTIPSGANSITFSTFDYNLWHRTTLNYDTPAVTTSPDNVRNGIEGYPHNISNMTNVSWYFGLEDPRTGGIWRDTQPGAETYRNDGSRNGDGLGNEASYNTYNVPGGAYGSLTSDSFSLEGYSPEDKPALYFTYKTDSDSNGSFASTNDLPAVFVSADGGGWVAVAVGNGYSTAYADGSSDNSYWNRTNEAQYNENGWTYMDYDVHYIDILENDNQWRQAKVDLSQFAGASDIRLKFVFSTAQGDIGIGTGNITYNSSGSGNVTGTLITAPTADIILDGRQGQNAQPGDGSLNYSDNSYFTIGNKTFQFVNGYSIYVPVTPGEYGNSLVLTINDTVAVNAGRSTITIPILSTDTAEQVIDKIITAVNGLNLRDSSGNRVTVKRYLDEYGNPTGQMIYFENAETFANPNLSSFVLFGGPQDRTLENIFAMTKTDLYNFLQQSVLPVPFRSDMTQSEIAGSITFMVNLAFNELLQNELNQLDELGTVEPLVIDLLDDINALLPDDNVIDLINSAIPGIRAVNANIDGKNVADYLVQLLEDINVTGRNHAKTLIEGHIQSLYDELALITQAALNNLRSTVTIPAGNILNAMNAARTALNSPSTQNSPLTVLNTLIGALGGDDALATTLRQGVAKIRDEIVTPYITLHRIVRLEQFATSLTGTHTNILQEVDTLSQQLLAISPQSYAQIINNQLNALPNRNQGAISDLIAVAQNDILADPANMYNILLQLRNDISSLLFNPVVVRQDLQNVRNNFAADGVDPLILDLIDKARANISINPNNTGKILQTLYDEIDLTFDALSIANRLDELYAYVESLSNASNQDDVLGFLSIMSSISGVKNAILTPNPGIGGSQTPKTTIEIQDELRKLQSQIRPLQFSVLLNQNIVDTSVIGTTGSNNGPLSIQTLIDSFPIADNSHLAAIQAILDANPPYTALDNIIERVEFVQFTGSSLMSFDYASSALGNTALDNISRELKLEAKNTASDSVSELLSEIQYLRNETAAQAINRVLEFNGAFNSTDPRDLITLISNNENLLTKTLRIDTSSVSDSYPTSYTSGLTSITNSIQMTLVNTFSVSHAGPLHAHTEVLDGTNANGLTLTKGGGTIDPIYRSQDNVHGGFYIDNIIVGFASRGEMVTNASENTDFDFTTGEERYIPDGSYQLEIRRGTEYATYFKPYIRSSDSDIWNLIDIKERLANGISLFAPSSAEIAHNQKFSISDGVNTLTFVFINTKFGGGSSTDIKIEFTDGDTSITIANKITTAINNAFKAGKFKVTATTGSQTSKTHSLVDLFNATDFLNLTENAEKIKHVIYGAVPGKQGSDNGNGTNDGTTTANNGNEIVYNGNTESLSAFLNSDSSRLYINPSLLTRTGDSNTTRQKGQLTIYGNSITHSLEYAITVSPGANPVGIEYQMSDYRNTTPLVPGIAITNNILAFNGGGGIEVAGLASAIPFVRILNNTFYGGAEPTGVGIDMQANTAATIINNVFVNLNTGIRVTNDGQMVLRSNTYQNAPNVGIGLGDKAQTDDASAIQQTTDALLLPAGMELFVNPERGNFYPKAGSYIIDTSDQSISERQNWWASALQQLGINSSVVHAPESDIYGQLRDFDSEASNGGIGGTKVAFDRGAVDRVDYTQPYATLTKPNDVTDPQDVDQINKTGDQLATRYDVYTVGERYNEFVIDLRDSGIGIDDFSVADAEGFVYEHIVTIVEETWNGTAWVSRTLSLGVDYFAIYNSANDQIILSPIRGQWNIDARYTIGLNNNEGIGESGIIGEQGLVNRNAFTLKENKMVNGVLEERILTAADYLAVYDPAKNQILFNKPSTPSMPSTPNNTSDEWDSAASYILVLNNGEEIVLNKSASSLVLNNVKGGIIDLAGNTLAPNRPADENGEEKTVFHVIFTGYDYGDASDPIYSTLVTSDGPRHVVYHGYGLGNVVSVDYSPYVSPNADGDDDDGVRLENDAFVAGEANALLIKISDANEEIKTARGTSTTIGYLNIFIDWYGTGFDDPRNFRVVNKPVTASDLDANGEIRIEVTPPSDVSGAVTSVITRVRLSSEALTGQTYLGYAKDGEVEDWKFEFVTERRTFGDAPAVYTPSGQTDGWHSTDLLWGYDKDNPTQPKQGRPDVLVADSGQQLYLGTVKPTVKAQPNYSVKADGNREKDDSVDFSNVFIVAGETPELDVTITIPKALYEKMLAAKSTELLYLSGWFDVNSDNQWGTNEYLIQGEAGGNGALSWNDIATDSSNAKLITVNADGSVVAHFKVQLNTVPAILISGESIARFRLSSQPVTASYGPDYSSTAVYDGDIEDFLIRVLDKRRDYGDALGAGNTVAAQGGAVHIIVPNLSLGERVDPELNGTPKTIEQYKANPVADNDGLKTIRLGIGGESFISIDVFNATGTNAYLNIWIDLNNDGDFDDEGEQLTLNKLISSQSGLQTITIALPDGIPAEIDGEEIIAGERFMRVRLSHQRDIGPTGGSVTAPNGTITYFDGEVEDYVVSIVTASGTIRGTVYHDLNADGKLNEVDVSVPEVRLTSTVGPVVPFLTGSASSYADALSYKPSMSYSATRIGFDVEIGGSTYDAFVVTSKGALMLVDYTDYTRSSYYYDGSYYYSSYGRGYELPSLYNTNTNPTLIPFLSNLFDDFDSVSVYYSQGKTSDGEDYIQIKWRILEYARDANGNYVINYNEYGYGYLQSKTYDFGICITNNAEPETLENNNVVGDTVTYFYSDALLERLKEMASSEYSAIQIGTNFGNTSTNSGTATGEADYRRATTFTSKQALIAYLESLPHDGRPIKNPAYVPEFLEDGTTRNPAYDALNPEFLTVRNPAYVANYVSPPEFLEDETPNPAYIPEFFGEGTIRNPAYPGNEFLPNPAYNPDFVAPPEFIYPDGSYRVSTYRLNARQATTSGQTTTPITNGVIRTTDADLPENVILPQPYGNATSYANPDEDIAINSYSISINSSSYNSYRRTSAVQSFGFTLEFGGNRYNNYVIYDNGTIGLINENGLTDASIVICNAAVSGTPTVDVNRGTSDRGNPYVQIRWNSQFGIYIENDVAGDIISFFYTESVNIYGFDFGGTNTSVNTHVYTNIGITPAFSYAGLQPFYPISTETTLGKISIESQAEYNQFYAETGGRMTFRTSTVTGLIVNVEPGTSGVYVYLLDENHSPVLDSSGNPVYTYSKQDGSYEFTHLYPGTYYVYEDIASNDKTNIVSTANNWIPINSTYANTINYEVHQEGEGEERIVGYEVHLREQIAVVGVNFGNFKQGTVSISDAHITEGNSGEKFVEIDVESTNGYGKEITVNYVTADGTATNGSDYKGTQTGTVKIGPQLLASDTWSYQSIDVGTSGGQYDRSVSGDFIAYEENIGTRWVVHVYNAATGEDILLSDIIGHTANSSFPYSDRMPSIVQIGNFVKLVWTSYDPSTQLYQVWYSEANINNLREELRDHITSVTESDTYLKNANNLSPQISASPDNNGEIYITWLSTLPNGQTEVYCINSDQAIDVINHKLTETFTRLTNNTVTETQVKIDGNHIVWVEANIISGQQQIMLYTIGGSISAECISTG